MAISEDNTRRNSKSLMPIALLYHPEIGLIFMKEDILDVLHEWMVQPYPTSRALSIRGLGYLMRHSLEVRDGVLETTGEFPMLGQLVALLALHSADSVREIGQASAEATYHLHHIIMNKMAKEMEKKRKNKKGKVVQWLRVDYFNSGPTTFYNNIPKVAEAFGEHLSSSQITELVLKAIGLLTHEEKKISQDAALVLSSFLEECGMDMEELLYHPEIGLIFMKEDILDVLHEWMVQPYPTSRALSIRGLGYLMRHSLEVRDGVLEVSDFPK
ncbi:uncharacterized protein PHA67_006692 [Liasis olivaceus]